MKKNTLCLALIAVLTLTLYAGPEDPGFGVYIAPMLGSGHFGVSATNMPNAIVRNPATTSVNVNPLMTESTRGPAFGGKLGIFYRPDNYNRRHRFDLEAKGDFFSNDFHFGLSETDAIGSTTNSFESWTLNGIGIVGRIRWSVELEDRWQPYVHVGYGVNLLSLGEANGVGHGFNLGAGMRVRLCSKYAFYFEYETSPMKPVNFAYSDLGKATGLTSNTIGIHPGYSQVTVAFEFPISFCIDCGRGGY